MHSWTLDDMPDLSGTTAVVTGANSGIGAVTALALARSGARTTSHADVHVEDISPFGVALALPRRPSAPVTRGWRAPPRVRLQACR